MNTIETLFVPYELAVKLKALGFNEPCFGNYRLPTNRLITEWEIKNTPEHCLDTPAPTFSQAFRWFREKYKLQSYIDFFHSESYFFKIKSQDGRHIGNTGDTILQGSPVFTRTYEEAELACLIKLIEIVEHQKQK